TRKTTHVPVMAHFPTKPCAERSSVSGTRSRSGRAVLFATFAGVEGRRVRSRSARRLIRHWRGDNAARGSTEGRRVDEDDLRGQVFKQSRVRRYDLERRRRGGQRYISIRPAGSRSP